MLVDSDLPHDAHNREGLEVLGTYNNKDEQHGARRAKQGEIIFWRKHIIGRGCDIFSRGRGLRSCKNQLSKRSMWDRDLFSTD
jgi:hypothetical protein